MAGDGRGRGSRPKKRHKAGFDPIRVQHSLGARGCNTHAAAGYSNLQLGGVGT